MLEQLAKRQQSIGGKSLPMHYYTIHSQILHAHNYCKQPGERRLYTLNLMTIARRVCTLR